MPLYSIVDLAGSASQDTFVFTSPYLSRDHMHVYIDAVETVDFTFSSAFIIVLDTPLVADATVRIRRLTPIAEPAVDFTNGSVLGESDLDASALQTLYVVQEAADVAAETIHKDNEGNFDALGFRIVNVADPIDLQDAATKRYTDESSGTAAQQAAVEQAEAAAAEAALTLVEIIAIDLTNVSEYMRTVLAAETAADARTTLDAITDENPTINNLNLTGTTTGALLATPEFSGSISGTYTLAGTPSITSPAISNPTLSGTVAGSPNFSGTINFDNPPTFDDPLPGTLSAGTQLVLDPYAVSSQPSVAHGLSGGQPTFTTWYLECLTNNNGYLVGDRVTTLGDGDTSNRAFCIVSDTDGATLIVTTTATTPMLPNKTTGAAFGLTAAQWKLVVTPWRIN
jgi:hypothetical protein